MNAVARAIIPGMVMTVHPGHDNIALAIKMFQDGIGIPQVVLVLRENRVVTEYDDLVSSGSGGFQVSVQPCQLRLAEPPVVSEQGTGRSIEEFPGFGHRRRLRFVCKETDGVPVEHEEPPAGPLKA